ncbi:hypothetical protein A4G99_10665 [Haladaptatus sp. R4]|uniref:hypothetical protein n=1 Tax=Haladaptatus sp. R4 TaxID=1679489 RepID=UPI0007B49A88|nr:hypothetical protein [Haladaptatus sp. R4]KZN24786.1 hypothetical protein A4G99_10665 [Haladaptatus sp. R4]
MKEGGHCTIKNCDILLEHPDASYCIWEGDKEEEGLARVRDCQLVARDGADGLYHGNVDHQNVGHNPDVSVPNGVPTSAQQAAKGGGHVGNPPNLNGPKNDISFSGGGDGTFDYYFRATGSVEGKHGIGGEDDVDGDSGDGSTVGTGTDTYLYERDVAGMSLNLDGYLKVHLNRSDGTVTFSGTDDGNTYGYYLEVTGDIYPTDSSDDHDVEADPNGDSVNGLVGSGSDKWQYTGELSHIGLDAGTATVDVTRRHKLEIEDYDDGKTGDYDFTVSGSVKKGSKANSGDSASGHSASGAVTGGTDSYIYTGRITDFNHSGAIHTYIDDLEVITPSLGHNTVTFEGSGSSKSYSFKVVGGLGKSAVGDSSINSGDDVSGRTASGAVSSGDDSYDYRDGVLAVDNKWKGLTPEFSTN